MKFLLPAIGFLCATIFAGAAAARPNVIVVLTDDQGYGDFSSHGNPVLKTPNLDRLRAESIRLTDFHSAPICTPARGQLMTGVDALRNGAQSVSNGRDFMRRDLPTMADAFAAGGYQCGLFGKWHLGDNYPHRPTDRGFHEVVTFPASQITSAPDFWNNDYFDDVYIHNNRREKYHGYATDVFFDEAMKWMRAQAGATKPFFCYLSTPAAHVPLFVPARYRELYDKADLPGIEEKQREEIARYFGMIANVDDNMARLETFLRASGLRDNTLLVFMTDNGGTSGVRLFNAGMKGGKFSFTEGGHRVPCFIRWPGGQLRPPGDIDELTQMQDIFPTALDLCGLKPPAGARFDGISLASRLRGEVAGLPDRMLVVNYVNVMKPTPRKESSAVLWRKWRLVHNRALHDLAADPGQTVNVADKFPGIAAKLRAHLDSWWAGVEPGINDLGAVAIGNDAEPVTQLCPQDRIDSWLDQSDHVRSGMDENGPCNLEVDRAGDYEFELRRWPREAAAAIMSGLPEFRHADGVFPAGVALPIAHARLRIGETEQTHAVAAGDKAVTFTVTLPAGRTQLLTSFVDAAGKELCGAYYVYVRRK
jgi:arylsulfatase